MQLCKQFLIFICYRPLTSVNIHGVSPGLLHDCEYDVDAVSYFTEMSDYIAFKFKQSYCTSLVRGDFNSPNVNLPNVDMSFISKSILAWGM